MRVPHSMRAAGSHAVRVAPDDSAGSQTVASDAGADDDDDFAGFMSLFLRQHGPARPREGALPSPPTGKAVPAEATCRAMSHYPDSKAT